MKKIAFTALVEETKEEGAVSFLQKHPEPVLMIVIIPQDDEEDEFMSPKTTETRSHFFTSSEENKVHIEWVVPLRKTRKNSFLSKITLGRAKNNDIVLRSSRISKLHCTISKGDDDAYFISDQGSANGTLVNGLKIKEKTPVKLKDGDTIKIWHFVFRYKNAKTLVKKLNKYR